MTQQHTPGPGPGWPPPVQFRPPPQGNNELVIILVVVGSVVVFLGLAVGAWALFAMRSSREVRVSAAPETVVAEGERQPRTASPAVVAITEVPVAEAAVAEPAPVPAAVATAPSPATPTSAPGEGELVLQSSPWSEVYVDGREMGATPLIVKVPAGTRVVRLVNRERGIDQEYAVEVAAGETVRRSFDLSSTRAPVKKKTRAPKKQDKRNPYDPLDDAF